MSATASCRLETGERGGVSDRMPDSGIRSLVILEVKGCSLLAVEPVTQLVDLVESELGSIIEEDIVNGIGK